MPDNKLDLSNIKLIIGLGNPGSKFSNTRHNIGEIIVHKLTEELEAEENKKLKAGIFRQVETDHGSVSDQKITQDGTAPCAVPTDTIFAIPTTYMNHSGQAVSAIANFYKISPEEILVIHDDLDLEPGQYKIKSAGSAGGHNGLRSIIQELGSDEFMRIRVGIGRPFPHKPDSPAEQEEISKYVLQKPSPEEQEQIEKASTEVIKILG